MFNVFLFFFSKIYTQVNRNCPNFCRYPLSKQLNYDTLKYSQYKTNRDRLKFCFQIPFRSNSLMTH